MRRIFQAALISSVLLSGCQDSAKQEPSAPPVEVATGPTPEQKAMAVLNAKLELAEIRAQKDKLINLRLLMLTNGRDMTPEEQTKHDATILGLEDLERKQLKIIAENE